MKRIHAVAIIVLGGLLAFWALVAFNDYRKIHGFAPAPSIDTPVVPGVSQDATAPAPDTIYLPSEPSWTGRTADLDNRGQLVPALKENAPVTVRVGDLDQEGFRDLESRNPQIPKSPNPPAQTCVALLTAEWCGYCKQFERESLPALKDFLSQKKTPFTVIDVDRDPFAADVLFAAHDKGLPQVVQYTPDANCQAIETTDRPGACTEVHTLSRLVGRHTLEEVKTFLADEEKKQDEAIKAEGGRQKAEFRDRRWLRRR